MADYPLFSVLARRDGPGLKDTIRMIRIDTAVEYRTRWQETAEAIIQIESMPLAAEDDLIRRGKRILAIEALTRGLGIGPEELAYLRAHRWARTLPADLPGYGPLVKQLRAAVSRFRDPGGPWRAYKRGFALPIQSFGPSDVWAKCGPPEPD